MKQPEFLFAVAISDIILSEKNPRKISKVDFEQLCRDINSDTDFLMQRPPLLNKVGEKLFCYAGHQRIKAAMHNGKTTVPAWVQEDVPEKLMEERMLKDNLHRGEWDYAKLSLFDNEMLMDVGFDLKEIENAFQKPSEETIKNKLQQDFIIPPFSVLDTRQGYWQQRKALWLDLGIESHESRESMETSGSLSGSVPGYYKIKERTEAILNRELSLQEFEEKYLPSHINEDSQIKHTESGGMLSVFDPVLCEVMYKWFCPDGGMILDPFAGGSVRGIVAAQLGFPYYGIDLRKEQVEANRIQAAKMEFNQKPTWYASDSNVLLDEMQEKNFDFIFSCPPYADLEKYSDDPADISNMPYYEFLTVYRSIITKSMRLLKENRFAVFVVGDVRDENGCYRNFVSDTIDCFTNCINADGTHPKLYNEIILLNNIGSLPVRVGRQFNHGRKVGKAHQNVLVFYKGDPKKIKTEFPELKNLLKDLQEKNYERNIALSVID